MELKNYGAKYDGAKIMERAGHIEIHIQKFFRIMKKNEIDISSGPKLLMELK